LAKRANAKKMEEKRGDEDVEYDGRTALREWEETGGGNGEQSKIYC